MIKMEINNEEVVCDKNIEITEELLTTSSTILNNCYPKSWETTHDYISNFYFPQDYSKCLIYDEHKSPGIPGITVTGSYLNINYDNTMQEELQRVYGNTYQETYTGKNLFDKDSGFRLGYITASTGAFVSENQTATFNQYIPVSSNITYTFSANTTVWNMNIAYYDTNKTYLSRTATTNSVKSITVTTPSNCAYILLMFSYNGSTTITQSIIDSLELQLEEGSTATTFEKFVGGQPSPNPDYPQNIETVTGLQTIDITGKNLFDKDSNKLVNMNINTSTLKIYSDNTCTLSYIKCQPNTTYTISRRTPMTNRFVVATSENTPALNTDLLSATAITNNTTTSITITTPATANYIIVRFVYNNSDDYNTYASTIQIEEGSQATTYEQYKEQNYLIDFRGKNLFNPSNVLAGYNINYVTGVADIATNRSILNYTVIKPNTDYIVSGLIIKNTAFYDKNKTFISSVQNSYTFTTPSNAYYLRFGFDNTQSYSQAQLEEGTTATTYEAFNQIELCKIGTYQDYLYKNNGKWYIHKEIGKVVFNGTESWNYISSRQGFTLSNYFTERKTNVYNGYCNCFNVEKTDTTWTNVNYCGWNSSNVFWFKDNGVIATSVSALQTWLSNNELSVYYVLATPTTEEITNTKLINQLNSFPLYNGINNIQVESNLLFDITLYYNYKDEVLTKDTLFCGVVKNTGTISLNPREPHYCSLQILDFKTFLSEGETLDFVISNKTISEAINMVVDEIKQYGFEVGNINISEASDVIGAYSTLEKTAYDVFQYLADITQSKWFTRMIDENKVAIDFYDIEQLPEKDDIEYNLEYFEENNIQDMTFSYSTQDYRNKQVMLSEKVYGSIDYTDNILADGYNTNFSLLSEIAVLKNVSVNGVSKTIATGEDKELGIEADFYYNPGENVIEANDIYTAGSNIEVLYTPLVKGRQIVYNNQEVNRIGNQTGRKGVISRYESRNDVLSSAELDNIGQSYIKYKGHPEITLTLTTYNNNLYNIGDIVYFNAPLTDLQKQYMVKKKTTQIIATTNDIFYIYELSSSYNSETAINYFDNQRAKATGNISAGEYITRNIDVENSANIIFNNLVMTELEITGDNILNCTLNSPLNN